MRILFYLLEEGCFSKQKKGAIFLYLKAFLNLLVNAHPFLFFKWWFRPELNWRHMDFQSIALPTELQNHLVAGEGFEPTTSGLWARRATRLLYPAICNGGGTGIRTQAPVSRPTGFQDRTLQPLGYSSVYISSFLMVDPVGLEPTTSRLWAGSSDQLS